jgi:alkanesulfonate monooxygenase SsuD/methylene tetrahydromethanopterin reductase-like flavin-dependent oxidoreductase (luciferase family)
MLRPRARHDDFSLYQHSGSIFGHCRSHRASRGAALAVGPAAADERLAPGSAMNKPDHGTEDYSRRRGFAVEGRLAHDIIRELAPAAEAAGYAAFWVNDEVQGDGLAALREAAAVTRTIGLGVGVLPLDRQKPERIAARVTELGLPVERLTLGVGSGHPAGGMRRVQDGVAALRELTDARVIIGAIGPRLCQLAGAIADGLLLDWTTPDYARSVAKLVATAAAEAGRPRPWLASYVFTALGPEATRTLRANAKYYASLPAYDAHFARMRAGPMATVACGDTPDAIQRALAAFDVALDETVVRAVLAKETEEAYLEVLRAASPSDVP